MFQGLIMKLIGEVSAAAGLIFSAIFVLGLLMIAFATNLIRSEFEYYSAMVIIFGIGVLLVLLLIMTTMFSRLEISNPKQALGLPEGSVRALVALILLLAFIIVGVFIIRTVGLGEGTGSSRITISDEGAQLSQQLLTTIATLVVAVSGFYFGTSAVTTARGIVAPSTPVIRDIVPNEGGQGKELQLKITGKNFLKPRLVKLVRGSQTIDATIVVSSDTEIQCRLVIPSVIQANTMWDLIVVNEDGEEDRLSDAFTVIPS